MENLPKNKENKEKYGEQFKKVLKSLFAYGMYAFISFNSNNSEAQESVSSIKPDYPTLNVITNENNATLFNKSKVLDGKNDFKYYRKDILDSYEKFYSYASEDLKFKESSEYLITKMNHSLDGKMKLKKVIKYLEDSNNENYIELLKDSKEKLKNFKLINDEKELFNIAMKKKYKNMLYHISDIEKQKKWLMSITASKTYLDRLTKEYHGNKIEAQKIQNKRIERLKSHNYFLSNHDYRSSKKSLGHVNNYGNHKFEAFLYNETNYTIGMVDRKNSKIKRIYNYNNMVPLHEFEHQADLFLISSYARKLFRKNIDISNMFDYQIKKIKYYNNPTEILARKRVFDYELEKLNIKKYEEDFTEDHYQKVIEILGQGKLDVDSEEFFRTFRKEGIMLIMNIVAENIDNDSDSNTQES